MSLWTTLLETAIHSPSPHNVQPWRVRIHNDNEADLLIDSARTLPKEDPTASFIILTMGMFIEALSLLAANRKHKLDYDLFHEPEWYADAILDTREQTFLPFARLRLGPAVGLVSTDHDPVVFLKRRTSRITLLPRPVPDEAVQALRSLAAKWDQRYEQITNRSAIERILKQNTRALFHDLNNPDYHDEITSWFRFTDRSSLRHRDGLDYRCMNTSRSAYWLTARFPRLLLLPGARSLLARTYRLQLGLVPTIGMLAGDFWQPSSAFKTGRFLLRFWLETARHSLYIHPYGNLVTNKKASQWMLEETKVPDIWLVFKIGYSAEPPKSYRLPVEDFCLIDRIVIQMTLWVLWLVRQFISVDRRTYLVMSAGVLQPLLARIGMLRAHAVFIKAKDRCPAYQEFLSAESYVEHDGWRLSRVPVMTKENYVKKYGIEQRCYDGRIPASGVVIDESSGSSGVPNNWVRSADEREDVKRILQLNYQLIYRDDGCILLNCFALGPWATGMNVSMSLVDVGILKSIGPDQKKLENTLELFGMNYRYLIFGYPPFIKQFVDSTKLDLSNYRLDLIVGGEGISEGLRSHLLKNFQSVISSYGASDLEINVGVETELTINLRRLCTTNRELCETLFGRETAPMIFQYNALDYVIETNDAGELLFTIGRQTSAAPKIRYNLRDLGGVIDYRHLSARLAQNGVTIEDLAPRQSKFPILFVFGRGDLTVPFYGAKVYPTDIEDIVSGDPLLVKQINSFQLVSYEDDQINRRLKIHLETVRDFEGKLPPIDQLRDLFFDGLCECNQDFREVTRMFERSAIEIEVHAYETGPFHGRDIRIKNKYIA